VDPLVTHTVGKPSALSPPLSDPNNTLTYVLGVEDTSHMADVTVRYAKFFSAKTRRHRVTATKGGYKWYQKLLSHFSRGFDLDRDQLETAELAQKELAEPVPNNVQDLKDHPLFALKRHLKRGEIIHPERKAGTIITGSGNKKKSEAIYRRADVKEVKTAEQWYKLGRNVKEEEVPMKFTATRKGRRNVEASEEEAAHQPMFMFSQTEVYVPPPVEFGIVPKNKFGNLDVFVPSMVPNGGVHIPEKEATKAARLLGVSFAEVVTGFEFRNRQVNAVIRGVVVAEEYKDAVGAVIRGFEEEREREAEFGRVMEALGRWRRWVTRLRIRERLGMEIAGRNENDELREEEEEEYGAPSEAEDLGLGGFMEYYDAAGGFIADDDDAAGGGFVVEEEQDTVIELPDANICPPSRYEEETDLSSGFIAKYEGIGELGDRAAEPRETPKEDTTIADSPPKKFSLPPASPLAERGNTDEELLSEDPDMNNEDLDWFQ
jgi:xeroderma pigmentosum group C-complementing protein